MFEAWIEESSDRSVRFPRNDRLMASAQPALRIAIAHAAGQRLAGTDRLAGAGVTFLSAEAVGELEELGQADAVVIDYALAGASEFLRLRLTHGGAPAIALVGRDGPCRTVEQSLLRAEADGAAIALPKPAGPAEIAIAALSLLDRRAPEAGWRMRLRELRGVYPA